MNPVFVVRPEPGCAATVALARASELEAQGHPLFAVRPLEWQAPPPEGFDALLIGSANALRHGGAVLESYHGKPAYVVGAATAEAARAARLDVVASGAGGLQAVLDAVRPGHARLLRLAGRERVALVPPAGIRLSERVVYASEALPMPPAMVAALRQGGVVLLHSREAAQHFAAQCQAHGIARSTIGLAALGPRIADGAGSGWREVASAERPDDQALLALARRMCQSLRGKTG